MSNLYGSLHQVVIKDPDNEDVYLKINSDGTLPVSTSITGVATETTLLEVNTSLNYIETNTGDGLIKQDLANIALASIDNKTPVLVGGRVPVDVSSLSVNISNASLEIANDIGNPIPVNGTVTANIGTTNGIALDTTLTGGTQRTKLTDGTNNASVVQYGTQLTTSNYGIATNAVIHGLSTGGGGGYVDVKVTPSGSLVTETTISGTVSVSASSLPLPTGAATSSLQTTGNTSLSNIDGKTPSLVQGTIPSLIYGLSEGGNDVGAISVSDEGHLEVSLQNPTGVFGELIVGGLYPLAQGDFAYGLNSNTVSSTVTGSGTATSTNQMAICSTTATTSSSATIRSVRTAKYRAGQGINARFTAMFTTGVANSTQYAGLFNAQDGFSFGYNGTAFGVLHRRNNVDTWIPRTSFNLDPLDGTGRSGMLIDPTKINIFKLQVGYLGVFGCVFSVINPSNGQWVECHKITFANTATTLQAINPTMWFAISAVNTTNNTNIVVSSGSFGVFLEGERRRLGGIYGSQNFKSIATTATNVLSLRCNTTVNGVTNNSIIRVRSLSVATAATVPVIFQAIKNTTLGGTPAYTNIDATNSLSAIDTAGTTVTGGTVVFNTLVGSGGNTFCDLTDFDIQLQPGETLTITANAISGAATNQVVAINWSEDT